MGELELAKPRNPMAKAVALRSDDARDDAFVRGEMARGEPIVLARRYTQARASIAAQAGLVSLPAALVAFGSTGSALVGLAGGAAVLALLGGLLVLEAANRIALTDAHLVVQTSLLMRRYERAYIEAPRVEILGPRGWLHLDVRLFDPRDFFRRSRGLRFRYAAPNKRATEVFIATPDAERFAAALGAG